MKPELTPYLAAWERMRTRGRTRYIWRKGVIGWGLPVGLLVTLFGFSQRGFSIPGLACAFVIWPTAGYCVGAITWGISERRYNEVLTRSRNR